MPIRFRCKYCDQLLGIAHRKAGTMVQCPTCQGQVLVPLTEEAAAAPAASSAPSAHRSPPLFERSDFDDLLRHPASVRTEDATDAVASAGAVDSQAFDAEPFQQPVLFPPPRTQPAAPGLFLSRTQATWLAVAVILLLALAFGLGLCVDRFLL